MKSSVADRSQFLRDQTSRARRTRALRPLCCVVSAIALAACNDTCISTAGTAVPARLLPADTTLAVGQSFVLRVVSENTACHAASRFDTLPAPHSIRANGNTVISLDTTTGRVAALAPGDAEINFTEPAGPPIEIHVR